MRTSGWRLSGGEHSQYERKKFQDFGRKHPQVELPLSTWYSLAKHSEWKKPDDIKQMFGANMDFLEDNRVIFDISGNKYRLVVHVSYEFRRVLIKSVGTHAEYDRINAGQIK